MDKDQTLMRTIVFSGGGSGGHVVPALTLIRELRKNQNCQILYIGSINGVETKLTRGLVDKYFPIRTGKLRRYISIQNLLDSFNVIAGVFQSVFILIKIRPSIIVLTGGFVTVPVVFAGFLLRIPMVLHEQTTRVGLANKIASYFVKKVMVSFESSLKFFPASKRILTGYPIRDSFFDLSIKSVTLGALNINAIKKPILFITGGGNGSELLNNFIHGHIKKLEEHFFIIHQTGNKHLEKSLSFKSSSYCPLGVIGDEYVDIVKMARVVISRSGAGTVSELLALGKKSIYVPLKIAQKNEQFHNAMEAKKLLSSIVIEEDDFLDTKMVLNEILNFEPHQVENSDFNRSAKDKILRIINF